MISNLKKQPKDASLNGITPLGVFLVKSDSNEEKLLFRYPHSNNVQELCPVPVRPSKYALFSPNIKSSTKFNNGLMLNDHNTNGPLFLPSYTELTSSTLNGDRNEARSDLDIMLSISDLAVSNLFRTVNHRLCDNRCEFKLDNVQFVGHLSMIENHCFHVVFALNADVPEHTANSYYELSHQIAIALKSEEKRCGYFTNQASLMVACHEEYQSEMISKSTEMKQDFQPVSPYKCIENKSPLANALITIFKQLKKDGIVTVYLNDWININFCLPQKVHRNLMSQSALLQTETISPLNVHKCLAGLRPYHTFLLLTNMAKLIDSLPQDVSPSIVRLIRVANPLKNLLELSADADITLSQVFNIVGHLVYWGKATIIFPLCETNVYMLHPSALTKNDSSLTSQFKEVFPNDCLLKVLSKFSLGVSLSQLKNPIDSVDQQNKLVQMVIWMLKKRMLLQLHTYVYFVPLDSGCPFLVQQRLSFTHSHLYNERPNSSFTDMNDTSDTTSSYQSEASSPVNASYLSSIQSQSLNMHSLNEISELTKSESSELNQLLSDINLSKEEIKAVLATQAADNLEDIRLFARLCSYFDGQHHIEDIMYYENLRRSQILTLIDKFRDVLITCQYEDVTVSELLPYKTIN